MDVVVHPPSSSSSLLLPSTTTTTSSTSSTSYNLLLLLLLLLHLLLVPCAPSPPPMGLGCGHALFLPVPPVMLPSFLVLCLCAVLIGAVVNTAIDIVVVLRLAA